MGVIAATLAGDSVRLRIPAAPRTRPPRRFAPWRRRRRSDAAEPSSPLLQIFQAINMPVPELVRNMQENKMGTCIGAWFLGNTISQNLISTGG